MNAKDVIASHQGIGGVVVAGTWFAAGRGEQRAVVLGGGWVLPTSSGPLLERDFGLIEVLEDNDGTVLWVANPADPVLPPVFVADKVPNTDWPLENTYE